MKEIKKVTEPNNAKTSIACPLRRSLHRKWAEASVKENGSREGANKKRGLHRKRAGEGKGGRGGGWREGVQHILFGVTFKAPLNLKKILWQNIYT